MDIPEFFDGISRAIKAIGGTLTVITDSFRQLFPPKNQTLSRIKKLNEKFTGYVLQNKCKDQCKLLLKEKHGHLTGTMTMFYGDCAGLRGESHEFNVCGSFKYNFLLTLQYSNADQSIHQAGVLILKLAPDGNSLKGMFRGYGPITQDIKKCCGEVSLNLQR
jgi:hypothetical protein